ncbi:E3 SUMO-protein ligase RanBP2 [Mytilus galloprovincialis]|uniref:Nuclear pore complex protein Nup153 n=1 Tax=Mytilus galloprovincialis TaxID=29158 RepID=A0A8B6H8V2_MYTGA|nr:E3 SUMO-protein ligase RanBP2 [Mytilus galloprovincialis]
MAECVDSQKTIDILTCAICLERFIKPKSLPCLHTFCEGCILTFITSELEKLEVNNHIECPVCRATVQLPKKECTPKEFVDQMPTNFLINGLLEKETTKRSEIKALKCDNVVTIEDEASKLCTDIKLERLKMDITNVSNDFDTLLSHYTECLQSNETQYEDKQKMIEISISTIISKVKALEITKKAELKKIYEEKKHILEDKMDTCTNCKKTVVSDKQTLEINIETASEVQVMFEAQKIASQVEKHKQLLKKYKFDGSKILISGGTGIPVLIDVFINSLFKISISNEDKILKLLTDDSSQNVNPVQKSSSNQSVGECLNPNKDKSDNIISGVKFGNTSSEQKSSGFSFQSGTKPTSAADIKFGQTTKAADSTTPATGSGFKFGGQTVSTVKTTTSEADTGKPPLSGGFKFGQLPESDKTKATPGAVSFGQSVSSTSTTEPTKSAIGGFTFQSPKPSGFSFGGETKSDTAKSAATFSFKPSAPMASPSPSATVTEIKNKPVSFKPSTPLGTSTVIPKPEPAKKDEKKGFGNQFKPKEGSWKCNGCLMSNNSDALKCPACQTIKPGVTKEEAKASVQPEKKEEKKGFGDLFKPKEGAWKCDGCLVSNNGDVLKCPACGTLKPGVKKEDLPKETEKSSAFGSTGGGFSFGGKGGFNFGTAGKSDTKAASGFTFPTPDSTKEKSESKPAGFTFTPTKSDAEKNKPDAAAKGFNFTLQPSATPEKGSSGFNFTLSPSKDAGPKSPPTDAEGMYMNKDGDDDHIHFEPIIELPSVVDVVTGEEDEEVLFQHRSKLFRFVDGEWKERGVGDIKISKHKESGKVRLLMRRAQIHKICLNHYLTQELELKPMPKTDGKAWIWFALDFSDGEPAMQQLAVKFKNQEIANGFKKAFDDAKAKLDSSVATQESPVRRVDDSDIRTDGVEFVKEEKATKEQITMARKFFLPDHFYLYENKPSCPGCIGCEDYEPWKKISPAKSRIPVKADTNSSNAKTNLFGQSRTSDLPKPKSESSVIGSTTVSSFSDTKGGMFGAGATEFSFSSIVKESETSSGGVFGGEGAFSFSDLAKQANSSTSPGFQVQDHTKQFSWTGTGQQLFSTGAGDGNEEGAEEADDSGYTYDPQYEPIIDLPDLVDTKTGEEDFEEMFRQRAKLFRFDKEANQWKEKGLGEMKILRHLVNSRYRLILRREQVLKLACNQWLTAELSFKPLPTLETSWCWVGQDFSDNEPVIEQLAIKFKTIELAQQFKQVIDTSQNEIRKQNSTATEKGDADIKPTTVVAQPEESRTVVAQPEESRTVVTQPEDAMKNVIEEQAKVEEDEEEDDDDYTTDEDEEEILFDKRIKFFSKEEDWKAVGLGTIKVIYDEDVNGNRIMVELDNKNVVCNHLVTKELNMSIDKKDCYWSPIDFSTDEPVRRHFRSQFSSEQAAQEFQKVFEEGRQLAQESEISERDIATFPHEITFPHAHGGSSQ